MGWGRHRAAPPPRSVGGLSQGTRQVIEQGVDRTGGTGQPGLPRGRSPMRGEPLPSALGIDIRGGLAEWVTPGAGGGAAHRRRAPCGRACRGRPPSARQAVTEGRRPRRAPRSSGSRAACSPSCCVGPSQARARQLAAGRPTPDPRGASPLESRAELCPDPRPGGSRGWPSGTPGRMVASPPRPGSDRHPVSTAREVLRARPPGALTDPGPPDGLTTNHRRCTHTSWNGRRST